VRTSRVIAFPALVLSLTLMLGGASAQNASEARGGKAIFPFPVVPLRSERLMLTGDFDGDGRSEVVAAGTRLAVVGLGETGPVVRQVLADLVYTGETMNGAAADLNGDGRLDLVVTPPLLYGIDVYLGMPDGMLGPANRQLMQNYQYGPLALGDMNGDGRPDLAVFAYSAVEIWLGAGDGTFIFTQRESASRAASTVAIRDFNEDGNSDLAAFGAGELSIFTGRGDGGINSRTVRALAGSAAFFDDFDGDGHQDVLSTSSFLKGDGHGGFVPRPVTLPDSRSTPGDWDGDGLVEQARVIPTTLTTAGRLTLYEADANWNFHPTREVLADFAPVSVIAADFDGDQQVDFAVSVDNGMELGMVLSGQGQAHEPYPTIVDPTGPILRGAADMNRDGLMDAIVAQSSFHQVLLQQPDGTFIRAGSVPIPSYRPTVMADMDEDGVPDLVNVYTDIQVWLSDGLGGFQPARTFTTPYIVLDSLTIVDEDGDGHLDVIQFREGNAYIYGGNGAGDVAFRQARPIGPPAFTIDGADFNGDGREDLLVTSFSGQLSAYLSGTGSIFGTAVPVTAYPCCPVPGGVTYGAGDADGDGYDDVFVAFGGSSSPPSSPRLQVFRFDSVGGFVAGPSLTLPSAPGDVGVADLAVADFTGDGRADVAVVPSFNTFLPDFYFVRSAPDGSLTLDSMHMSGGGLTPADVDGDGEIDLFSSGFALAVIFNVAAAADVDSPPIAAAAAGASGGLAECEGPSGAMVTLDGSGSSDPDSTPGTQDNIASYEWFEHYGEPGEVLLGTGASLNVTLPLGPHSITLRVTDVAGESDTDTVEVTVRDSTAPALVCPTVLLAECAGPSGAMVSVVASASDVCGGLVIVNSRNAGGADASGAYPFGSTNVTFTATDASSNQSQCTVAVQVRDTQPPTLSVLTEPSVLWPPNHDLVPVGTSFIAQDLCDSSAVRVELVSVTSSEPDDAAGPQDGATAQDIQQAAIGTADASVLLRSEREGKGPGRVYELIYRATDGAGNTTTASGVVTVPHDQGQGPEPVLMRLEPLADGSGAQRIYWPAIHDATGYDVIRGTLSEVRHENGVTNLGAVAVLARNTTVTTVSEPLTAPIPPVGEAFFYLVQERTADRATGWGSEPAPWPRQPGSCDGGCPSVTNGTVGTGGDQRPARR